MLHLIACRKLYSSPVDFPAVCHLSIEWSKSRIQNWQQIHFVVLMEEHLDLAKGWVKDLAMGLAMGLELELELVLDRSTLALLQPSYQDYPTWFSEMALYFGAL